jgi:hypothetical protein
MAILDLDLDFFLDVISDSKPDGGRLDGRDYHPWTEEEVVDFLEKRCGLSRTKPIKGIIVEKHHEAFFYWRNLVLEGQLKVPFEVVHIDAHSDLGKCDWGFIYLMGELLHNPPEERTHPKVDEVFGLGEGNYLAFAVACRWIRKITFVLHPQWKSDADLLDLHFKDFDINSGYLQLKKYLESDVYRLGATGTFEPLDFEPQIPFEMIPSLEYKNNRRFSFMILSHSPDYTPKTSDNLIPIIKTYMNY